MLHVKVLKFLVVSAILILAGIVSPVSAAVSLEDALDTPMQADGVTPLAFTTDGAAVWSADTTTTYTAGLSAKSGSISGSLNSSLTTTIIGPASISFYQKVSSEPIYDALSFYIDNLTTPKYKASGNVNWQQKIFSLPTGTHTLLWKYSKNAGNISKGNDAAWLDKVIVSPNTVLKVTSPNGKENLVSGSTVTITWNAPAAAEKYSLYYTTNNGVSWIPIPGASAPSYFTSTDFTDISYPWTVPAPNGNMTTCKVKVVAYNTANAIVGQDMSDLPFTITVLKVTSPNGGEALSSKTTPTSPVSFTIYGQQNAASAVFSYSTDGGLTWPAIGTMSGGLAPGDHTYNWNVPASTALKNAKVKVVIKSATGAALGTDTSDLNFTIQPVFTISGIATLNGKALSGVTMTLAGDDSATTTTDALGKYSFTKLLKGSYTITASLTGSVFNPAVTAFSITTANIATANFAARSTSDTSFYTLSGTVSGATNTNVTLVLSGTLSGTVMTSATGTYSFPNLPEGNYNVTPVKAGFTFDPVSAGFALTAEATDVDFTSTAGPAKAAFSVSGKVTYGGVGLGGVTVAANGPVHAAVVTDALGNYTVKGLASGSYVITPSLIGFDFTPVNKSLTVAGANIAAINFTAGRNIGALNGSYRALQQSMGFFLYPGATGTAAGTHLNGYVSTLTFDGAGNCTIRDDGGTEYTMINDPGNIFVSATTPTTNTIPCTYSMSPDGTATVNIDGFHLPVWLSADGNTFIWGGGGWDNNSIVGGATPVLSGSPVWGEQTVGVKKGGLMTAASVNGAYRLVQQAARVALSSDGTTTTWSQVEGYTATMTFDGQGSCAVHDDPAATYDMFEPNTIIKIPHAAEDSVCTYSVAYDGAATVSFGGFEVPVWFSADGNTFIWDSSITAIGAAPVVNGDAIGHEQVVGVKMGTGMTTASLNGRYAVVQQSIGFGLYGDGMTTGSYSYDNGYTSTVTFNGLGTCSFHDNGGTEYSAANNPGSIIKNISGPGTTACTYTMAANGTATVNIGGFHLPIWLSADGNTFIWGGSGWSNSSISGGATPVVNGGPVMVEQTVGVRIGAQPPLTGSWYFPTRPDGHIGILTFIDTKTFMYGENGPNDWDSWPGIDYGTYTSTANTFKMSVIADTNGGWGMSNLAGRNIPFSISGPLLTLGADDTANVVLTKIMPSQSNPLIGSWLLSPATGAKAGHIGVLTFIDDSTFMYEEYGPADIGGSSGMEYGKYTWTGTTFNPTTFLVDTNGNWGFSDAVGVDISYTITGSTISFNGGTTVMKRIE